MKKFSELMLMWIIPISSITQAMTLLYLCKKNGRDGCKHKEYGPANIAMQQLLMQMRGLVGQQMPQQSVFQQDDEEYNQRAYSERQRKEASPTEREVEVNMSTNYTSDRPIDDL